MASINGYNNDRGIAMDEVTAKLLSQRFEVYIAEELQND